MGVVDFEKQARDAVSSAIVKEPGAAISVILQQIGRSAQAAADTHEGVAAATLGGMTALWNANQDLPDATVKILGGLTEMSIVTRAGPEQVMTWVLQGIATASDMAGAEIQGDIRSRIEETFQGAGDVFQKLCDQARAKRQ